MSLIQYMVQPCHVAYDLESVAFQWFFLTKIRCQTLLKKWSLSFESTGLDVNIEYGDLKNGNLEFEILKMGISNSRSWKWKSWIRDLENGNLEFEILKMGS